MSRSPELVTWLCARLEDLVARVQAAAPAAIVNVETHPRDDGMMTVASSLATPESDSLDLGFRLVREGDVLRLNASLTLGSTGEVLAELGPIVAPEAELDTPALREQLLAFIAAREPDLAARLHAEARGSEHEAELLDRLREQGARAQARGEFEEARHAYRMATMLGCDDADLAHLVRVEAESLREHLRRLAERFPTRRDAIARVVVE